VRLPLAGRGKAVDQACEHGKRDHRVIRACPMGLDARRQDVM
jgi:hypothetical protein